jgi:hypothetical protein
LSGEVLGRQDSEEGSGAHATGTEMSAQA